uniref:EH domain-binding protein 1 n=1 Tax=Ascaris lumbricoides TaxID=6252 RepID=A0A9J2PM43_ASCLU
MSVVWRRIQRSNKKAAKYRFTITPQELLIVGSEVWKPNVVIVACDEMSVVWRRIQRSNKKAAKYRFTITPQELLIVGSEVWKPNVVIVACMHRRRRVEGKKRKWEGSFADPCRGLIVWPTQTPDPLYVETTLYGDTTTREYDDKEWTLVVEECTAKGKRRTIAAVNLNMRLFVQSTPGTSSEVKLKMRTLWTEATHCSIQVLITSMLIGETDTNDAEVKSETSSVTGGRGASFERDIAELEEHNTNTQHIDGAAVAGISIVSSDIEQWKARSMEDATNKAINQDKGGPNIENERDAHLQSGFANAEVKRDIEVMIEKSSKQGDENVNKNAYSPLNGSLKNDENRTSTYKPTNVTIAIENNDGQKHMLSADANATYRAESKVEPSFAVNSSITIDNRKNEAFESTDAPRRDKVEAVEPPKELPEMIEGEELLAWCQRVTQGYPSVKITDFTKSFRSGLALCAIIHRYHPEMIGYFGALDFSDSHSGRRENCRKALAVAVDLGVNRKLDAGVIATLPDRHEIQNFLTELRVLLEGAPQTARRMSTKESDHRISALFNLSESETSVMRELESLRKQREQEEAIDLTNVPEEDHTRFDAVAPGSVKSASLDRSKQIRRPANPFDSDSDDEQISSSIRFVPAHAATVNGLSPMHNGNASTTTNGTERDESVPLSALSSLVTARHEELLKKRRQIIDDTKLESPLMGSDAERTRRLREEARRLMETAANEGTTMFISESAPVTTHQSPAVASTSSLQRRASAKLAASLGSHNELRCLDDAPLIAAFERPTQRLYNSQSDVWLYALFRLLIRNDSWPSAFDRVRRYGSMRGQELADTVARMAGITKDLEKMQEEQSKIADRLAEVSDQDEKICALLKRTKASSEEEERLLREHMRLLNEKDALVRRSEYFNVLEQLKEVQDDIKALQKKLSSASCIEHDEKTEEDKQNIDRMMDELVSLVNKKDQLSQKLIHHEAEDEEFDERDRLTLEAAANFSRGYEQPISASRRLITWIRSEMSS